MNRTAEIATLRFCLAIVSVLMPVCSTTVLAKQSSAEIVRPQTNSGTQHQTEHQSAHQSAQLNEQSLIGIWEAEQVFTKSKSQRVVFRLAGEVRIATVDGEAVSVNVVDDSVKFVLPKSHFRFQGKFDKQAGNLSGFWIQPPSQNINYPLATPLRFLKKNNCWEAKTNQSADRLRFYLCISKPTGKPLEAFFRNPERNLGIRMGYLSVEQRADHLVLKSMRDETVFECEEIEMDGAESIRINLPWSDQPFVFTRARKNPESGFYSSVDETPYTYRKPTLLDDQWPIEDAAKTGFDKSRLESLIQEIRNTKTTELTTPYIHSLLISRNGKLVLEEYFCGYDQNTPHDMRSAGKSFGSMLIGAVMDRDEQLDENRTLFSIFGERMREPSVTSEQTMEQRIKWRKQMTIGHALSMRSGLDADDNNYDSPGGEDRMQDQSENKDWVKFALGIPMIREPNTKSVYASNSINLAAAAVAEAKRQWIPELFEEHLATPLKIHNYHFNLDPAGNGYLGGGIRITPRDQLKLGQVMLDGGKWHGRQVLPQQWVKKSIQPYGGIHEENDYGYGWWRKKLKVENKDVEVFHASGNGGQLIVCIPEFQLVIQMSGGNYSNFPVWYRNLTELIPQQILTAIK